MSVAGLCQQVVGVVGTNSKEYIDEVFAIFAAGNIVVTLKTPDDRERIEASGATSVVRPGTTSGWIELPAYRSETACQYAQLMFTSGTEGAPKGILLTHSNLANTVDRLVDVMEIDSSIREYVGIPVYYSFGFGRVRVLSKVGGKCYLPQAGFSPYEISSLLAEQEINALSAVPTLLRLLFQERELFKTCGANLRWLEIGSQYMSQQEKSALKEMFPNARIVQHYGLTEASRTTFLKVHGTDGRALESVGQCYGGSRYRLVDGNLIQIQGPHVATQMLVGGELQPLLNKDGWLTTSDLGHVEEGHLFFDGRADDLINCGGTKISAEALQQQLHEALQRNNIVAVAKIPDELRGEGILIAYLKGGGTGKELLQQQAERLLRRMGLTLGSAVVYFPIEGFPLTETGKLQRKRLTELYLAQRAKAAAPVPALDERSNDLTSLESRLIEIWERALDVRPISIHDNFFDVGGDSLSSISVSLEMEKLGIPRSVCQQIFRGTTIAEIVSSTAGEVRQSGTATAAKSINITRGLLVLAVIASHWMPGVMEHLSATINDLNRLLAPLYSAGTPGFTIVFGIGVGFFYLHRYRNYPDSTGEMIKRNAAILFVGLLCLASVRIVAQVVEHQPITPVAISNSFWSVIAYYLLAVLTLPLWLRYLARYSDVLFPCLFMSTALFAAHILIDDVISPAPSQNPIIQILILFGTAKYNYFELSAAAFVGIAIGAWYRSKTAANQSISQSAPLAALMATSAILLSHEMGDLALWFKWPKSLELWAWIFYLGIVMLLVDGLHRLLRAPSTNRHIDILLNVLATIGTMAFPLFIGHEIVLPLRDVLAAVGVPAPLVISMLVFFVPAIYLTQKLYLLYFGEGQDVVRPDREDRRLKV